MILAHRPSPGPSEIQPYRSRGSASRIRKPDRVSDGDSDSHDSSVPRTPPAAMACLSGTRGGFVPAHALHGPRRFSAMAYYSSVFRPPALLHPPPAMPRHNREAERLAEISALCREAIQSQRERETRQGYGLDDYTEGRIVGAANLARKILRAVTADALPLSGRENRRSSLAG